MDRNPLIWLFIHLLVQQDLLTHTTLDLGSKSNLRTNDQSNKKGLEVTAVERSVFVCSESFSSIHFQGIEMQMTLVPRREPLPVFASLAMDHSPCNVIGYEDYTHKCLFSCDL